MNMHAFHDTHGIRKMGLQAFMKKHPESIIILKMVNDPLFVWKKNHSITMFRCYLGINKGHDHILLIKKSPRPHEKIFYVILRGWNTADSF